MLIFADARLTFLATPKTGTTAVEMALLRADALNIKAAASKAEALGAMGFGKATPLEKKKDSRFF